MLISCWLRVLRASGAGEVPKFFDTVLAKRASEAVTLKGHWWDARRSVAEEGVKEKASKVCAGVCLRARAAGFTGSISTGCAAGAHGA